MNRLCHDGRLSLRSNPCENSWQVSTSLHTLRDADTVSLLFDEIHAKSNQSSNGDMHAVVQSVIRSDCFTVMPQPKRLPKAEPPAEILLALAAQGAKLKLRKPNEDRFKRKPDWSIQANDAEWAAQAQLMGPPPPPPPFTGSMSMAASMPTAMTGYGQVPQQQPYHIQTQSPFVQTNMPMNAPQYSMGMQTQTQLAYQQHNVLMHTPTSQELPPDFNFGAFQDPAQIFAFQGAPPSDHGYGPGYGSF